MNVVLDSGGENNDDVDENYDDDDENYDDDDDDDDIFRWINIVSSCPLTVTENASR